MVLTLSETLIPEPDLDLHMPDPASHLSCLSIIIPSFVDRRAIFE
jgi:hypothetical protein